jgi:hypothetical protein
MPLGMDLCSDNGVIIDFQDRKLILNADIKENCIALDFEDEGLEDARTGKPAVRDVHLYHTHSPLQETQLAKTTLLTPTQQLQSKGDFNLLKPSGNFTYHQV